MLYDENKCCYEHKCCNENKCCGKKIVKEEPIIERPVVERPVKVEKKENNWKEDYCKCYCKCLTQRDCKFDSEKEEEDAE
jgi:hypothetical protein